MRPKPNLKNGKLIPPSSLEAALKRRKELDKDIREVERQIATKRDKQDGVRVDAAYMKWLDSARASLAGYKSERNQLVDFIAEKADALSLFLEAYELLKKLELEIEEDFEPAESELMKRLDIFFGPRPPQKV